MDNSERIAQTHSINFLLLLILLLVSRTVWAQLGNSSISGTITDASGATVLGAIVTVQNVQTGTTITVTSNTAGMFSAPQLWVGEYQIQAQKPGFRTTLRKGVTVTVGASVIGDIILQVGGTTENVEVTAGAPVVDTATSELGLPGKRAPNSGSAAQWARSNSACIVGAWFSMRLTSARTSVGVLVRRSGTRLPVCEPRARPFCWMAQTSRAFGTRDRGSL